PILHQLEQARYSLVDRVGITPAERATQVDSILHHRYTALEPQAAHALGKEGTDQTKVICSQVLVHCRHIPARQVAVDPIHPGGVITHFRWQRAKQMPYPLLMLDGHIKVPDKHHGAIGTDAFLATAELTGLHVALHDVNPLLGVEGDPAYLIKTDHIVLTHQAALSGIVVHEHL